MEVRCGEYAAASSTLWLVMGWDGVTCLFPIDTLASVASIGWTSPWWCLWGWVSLVTAVVLSNEWECFAEWVCLVGWVEVVVDVVVTSSGSTSGLSYSALSYS